MANAARSASSILFPRGVTRAWQAKHTDADALVALVGRPDFVKADALAFLHRILMPRSLQWSYLVVGKTGSSSVLMALHQLEFGHRLSARSDAGSLNADAIGRQLASAGLLSPLIEIDAPLPQLEQSLRMTSVRHPAKRLLSAWLYLGEANRRADAAFLQERLLMTIMAGIDWDRDAGTVEGFDRFLDFLLMAQDAAQGISLDLHLLPMHRVIHRHVFKPHLVMRLETLSRDISLLAQHLRQPVPETVPAANQQRKYDAAPFFASQAVQGRLIQLCSDDCKLFGYELDPDAPPLGLADRLTDFTAIDRGISSK